MKKQLLRHSLVLSAALSLVMAQPAGAGPAEKDPASPPAATGALPAVEAAGQVLNGLVDARSALAGYFDAATGGFVVVLPAGGPGSASVATDFPVPGFTTTVRRSALTHAAVDAVNEKIAKRAERQFSYGSHYDAQRDALVVESNAPWEVAKTELAEHAGLVEFRNGVTERNTRRNDPPPHWGGASITNGSGSCTSAFAVKNGSGTRFMVTAGHCFALGNSVSSPEGGHAWGTVVDRAPFPTWDMELIGGNSYGTSIYVGNTTGSGSAILGAADPTVGVGGYCVSGQSGEKCGKTVTSLSAQFCDSSGCTTELASYTGGSLTVGGDSGAPFYLPGAGGSQIRGMHIALSGSTMYAERWNSIASRFGVSIVP